MNTTYEKLYRYTSDGEGIFSAGKRLLPEKLVDEAWEARKWMPKPNLPEGNYRFFLTLKGRDQYEKTLLKVHQKYLPKIQCEEIDPLTIGKIVYGDEWQVVVKNDDTKQAPFSFKSFNDDEFKIVEVKPCAKKFLFHSSGKKLTVLDPQYNRKLEAYGSVHEYGVPVVYASDKPSNAFCYEPTELYRKTRDQYGSSVYHRLIYENHKILLGANLKGYIYVLSGADFFEVTRDDFETGKWIRSVEWISPHVVTPIEVIEIIKPYDWEMLPEYEFLGSKHVGELSANGYLSLAKDETVKVAIQDCIQKPFISFVPEALKKYLIGW